MAARICKISAIRGFRKKSPPLLYILTAQADAFRLALREAGDPRVVRQLEPGAALCFAAKTPERPVFLRHMCPAQAEVPLTGGEGDIASLVAALAPLMPKGAPGERFSVQARVMEGFSPAYKRFDVNTALAAPLMEAGALLDVKSPARIVSVTLAEGMGWIGVSTAAENLTDWAGGMRRFKREDEQVSRAEFKLLEALEAFAVPLPDKGRALDLGAAPGGWTRVLRGHGLAVTAVDPAALDPRVARDPGVTHYRGTAQQYFGHGAGHFDMLVNDMKMDTEASAALTAEAAKCLAPGGRAILTLKLPEKTAEWLPRVARAEAILKDAYHITGLRQLFHNRSEVTAYLTRL